MRFSTTPRTWVVASALALCCLSGRGTLAQSEDPATFIDISKLMPAGDSTFVKVEGSQAWSTSYRGKNMPKIDVRIMGLRPKGFPEMVVFVVNLSDRSGVPLSRNLLVKLLEMNADYDYAKVTLSDSGLAVRIDQPMAGMNADRIGALASGLASVAEEVFSEVKNFTP